jgi:hypothetical protein
MTDAFYPGPQHKFHSVVDRLQTRTRSDSAMSFAACCPMRRGADARGGGRVGVNLHDNDLVPIDAAPAERGSDRARLQERMRALRHHRADGDGESVLRPAFRDGA